MKKTVVVLLAALVWVAGAGAQEPPPVVTLSQSIEQALAQGDDMRILQANLDVGRAQHAQNVSRNSFALSGTLGLSTPDAVLGNNALFASKASSLASGLPSPGLQAGLGLSGPLTSVGLATAPWIPPTGSGDSASGVSLIASQVLWNGYPGGPAKAAVDKSLLALQGKELSTDQGRLALIFQVKQAYFTLWAAQQARSVKKETLDKQTSLLAQINAIYALKQASTVDLQTAQINAKSAELDLKSADHDVRLARIRLGDLMGWPPDRDFTVLRPDEQQLPAATVEEAVATALEHRTEIKQIALSRKSTGIDAALARGQATPTVSVSAGLNFYLDWGGTDAALASAGVKVAMPILDAGAAKSLLDAAQGVDRVYSTQEQQLHKSIAADVQDAWETVQLQKERAEIAKLAAENSDLLLEVYRIQNQNGTASTQDLLTASVNAAGAHTAAEQAQSNAQLAVLQLLYVMGL